MKKCLVKITKELILEYDENSPEFKEALSSYKECINSSGTWVDMLKHIGFNIDNRSEFSLVEGVGYLTVNGFKHTDDVDYCGVDFIEESGCRVKIFNS